MSKQLFVFWLFWLGVAAQCLLYVIVIIPFIVDAMYKKPPVAEADNRHKVIVFQSGQEIRRFTTTGEIKCDTFVKFRDGLSGEEVNFAKVGDSLVIIEKF